MALAVAGLMEYAGYLILASCSFISQPLIPLAPHSNVQKKTKGLGTSLKRQSPYWPET